MSQDQIERTWRKHLIEKLQDHYGLPSQDAKMKADRWLRWIGREPLQISSQNAVLGIGQAVSRKSRTTGGMAWVEAFLRF
jgi:hypothetical protein